MTITASRTQRAADDGIDGAIAEAPPAQVLRVRYHTHPGACHAWTEGWSEEEAGRRAEEGGGGRKPPRARESKLRPTRGGGGGGGDGGGGGAGNPTRKDYRRDDTLGQSGSQ